MIEEWKESTHVGWFSIFFGNHWFWFFKLLRENWVGFLILKNNKNWRQPTRFLIVFNIYYNQILKVLNFDSFENSWFSKPIFTNLIFGFKKEFIINKELRNFQPIGVFCKMTLLWPYLGPSFIPNSSKFIVIK